MISSFLAILLATSARSQLVPGTTYLPPDPSSGYGDSLAAQAQWSNLLGNQLWFYEAQRSGKLPADNRVSWRNDSALDDGQLDGVDLAGGYYDAGDYIKATYPLAFSLFSICWGANIYGGGYEAANQTAYLDAMLRWGLDWLMKANPDANTLYVQVGDTVLDNSYWGGDQGIPGPRKLLKITQSNPGTDIAARTAAAFASCSALYNNFALAPSTSAPAPLTNNTYAATLLAHANQLYTLSQQKPFQLHSDAIKGVDDWAYPSSSYKDEQVLAEVMMAVAVEASGSDSTGSAQSHLDNAASLYSSNKLDASDQDVVMNWDSVYPAIPVLLTQIAALGNSKLQPDGGASKWQGQAETYFDRVVKAEGNGYLTDGGLLFYKGDSTDASLNPAANAAQLLFMYGPMASSSSKTSSYQDFALKQWNYMLGNNPMNMPYIVGSNPNSPTKPHDAKSHGGNDGGTIDTNPENSTHIIYGAVVGGPNSKDNFWNIRSDWPETEIALDYNAPFLTLAAFSVLKISDPPYYTKLAPGAYDAVAPSGKPCDSVFPCDSGSPGGLGLSKAGEIAMAVCVSVAGLIIFGLLACWIFSMRRHSIGGEYSMGERR